MGDSVKIDCNVEIPMRDGTILRADVYRPDDAMPHPVLLARLPYSKDLSPISLSLLSPIRAAKRDYDLNTGGDFANESTGRPAIQQVFHGGVRASHVLLPIIPQS